jgi:hypothetical protein
VPGSMIHSEIFSRSLIAWLPSLTVARVERQRNPGWRGDIS